MFSSQLSDFSSEEMAFGAYSRYKYTKKKSRFFWEATYDVIETIFRSQ